MADIHLEREHNLGLSQAREIAARWTEQAEQKFDMRCTREEGESLDEISFTRSGVSGTLKVSGDKLELDAKLGFLLGTFKERIESEIEKNLDTLLASLPPAAHQA